MQKPYPKLAIVGTGSPETIAFAAERGWGYASVFVPTAQQVKTFAAMREMSARYGHEMTPDKALVNTIIYVAESDEQAEREAREHIEYYFTTALRTTPRYLAPPGYISLDQFRIRASAANLHGSFDWKEMTDNWRVVCGTPQHVAVIGAGFAGLAAALRLARAGARVTVLDALDGPGGKAALGMTAFSSGPTVVTMPRAPLWRTR